MEFFQSSLSGGRARDPRAFQNLTRSECIRLYGSLYITDRQNVFAVTQAGNAGNESLLLMSFGSNGFIPFTDDFVAAHHEYHGSRKTTPSMWICTDQLTQGSINKMSDGHMGYSTCPSLDDCTPERDEVRTIWMKNCDWSSQLADPDNWEVGGFPVSYCLSELYPERCELHFSLSILIIVIFCNAVKAICMARCVRIMNDQPLITVGDAVASFLATPDDTTAGLCLLSGKDFTRRAADPPLDRQPRLWRQEKHRWFSTASKSRWFLTLSLLVSCYIFPSQQMQNTNNYIDAY